MPPNVSHLNRTETAQLIGNLQKKSSKCRLHRSNFIDWNVVTPHVHRPHFVFHWSPVLAYSMNNTWATQYHGTTIHRRRQAWMLGFGTQPTRRWAPTTWVDKGSRVLWQESHVIHIVHGPQIMHPWMATIRRSQMVIIENLQANLNVKYLTSRSIMKLLAIILPIWSTINAIGPTELLRRGKAAVRKSKQQQYGVSVERLKNCCFVQVHYCCDNCFLFLYFWKGGLSNSNTISETSNTLILLSSVMGKLVLPPFWFSYLTRAKY